MKLIKEKYRRLHPTMDYLADEVVMAKSTSASVRLTITPIPWRWFEVF